MENNTQGGFDKIKDLFFWLLLLLANIFSFNFYWALSNQELLDLSWFHELIVFVLWFFSLGVTVGAYFQLKEKNWINFIVSILLGLPLLFVTTWAVHIFRSNAFR